jgi:hypothetical protein
MDHSTRTKTSEGPTADELLAETECHSTASWAYLCDWGAARYFKRSMRGLPGTASMHAPALDLRSRLPAECGGRPPVLPPPMTGARLSIPYPYAAALEGKASELGERLLRRLTSCLQGVVTFLVVMPLRQPDQLGLGGLAGLAVFHDDRRLRRADDLPAVRASRCSIHCPSKYLAGRSSMR